MDPHDSAATRQKGSNRDEVKEKMPLQRKWASEPSASTKQNTFCEPEVKHRESLPCGVMRGSAPQQKYPMTGNPVQLLSGPSVVGAIGGPPSADPHGPLTQGFPRGYPYQLGQPYPQHPQTERFISGAKPQPGLESHAWPFAGQLPSDDPYGHPGHTHLHRAGRFPRQKSPSLPSSFGQYSQSGLEPGEESYSKKEQKAKKPGKYICHYCGRACAKPSVLKKHIRSHTGERPYPCEPCGFSFKTKSNLYKHRKSHAHAIKAGLVPFSSELAVSHSEDVGQASPVGEGEAPSDGEQSTDTDEEGVEGSTMLMEKHSPIPQISFEANKTAGGGEPAYADSAEEFHIGSMKVPILIFPKPGVVPPGGMDCPTFHDVKMSHHMLTSQAGGRSHSLDDSATIKRLAQRMEDKKGQDSDTSISQSLNLLSPHSKGSTDSGYFSPYDSAELQIGTPNASAKTYEEIMFGRTWYNRPNSRSRQSMTVGMAGVEGNESLKQQDLEMCKIAEDHPSFRENLETSGDAKQYPTGPCQSNTGLLEPPSESGTLIRSRSMPAPVPSNLNTPQGIRGSISFDNMVAPDDVFYPPGQPKLKRQSAFEHPANESHTGEADGHTQMAKNLASSVGLKIAEGSPGGPDNIIYNQYPSKVSICEIATRKRRKEKSVGDDEDSPENCDSSCSGSVDMMGDYDFKQGSLDGSRATPTGKKSFHSAHSQSDSFDTCVSMCSEDIVLFSDSEGRKPAGNVISVIQHTNSLSRPNSFEKSESFEQPAYQSSDKAPSSQYSEQSDTDIYEDALSPESALLRAESMEQQQSDSDLASFSSSSAAASPGQAYHKLVRQPNIQVPEIRVTEEPDKPEKDTEPLVTKEPEKPPPAVEEFQLPQRSDTLSQMPTEKLPPKKKRLRLADLEYSSGESSFESTCTSLSRSPSQESNLSHSSSMSMSFEKDEGVKSVSPTKQEDSLANVSGAKQSEFLTVPSSFSSLHQQREMRRSSSEQAPCTLHTELPEMRSKSFDYGSLPSCRQGEIYTSASAKKERRRGYLVRQASLSVYPEAVQQDTGGGQVSIKQESLEHGVWPVPSGSPHSTSEMAARTRRPGTGSHHQPPQHVLQQSISDDSLQDEPCFGRPKQHRLQAQGSSSEGEHPALEVRNRDLIQQHQSGVPFATFSQPGGFWNQESEQVVSQQQFQKLHVRSSSSLPGPAAPTESVQQINDPQLYEEKTKHQGTHIYSPSFPSHMNMLKRHLQPTQNLSSKATLPGLLVPVRIQTYVPMFGRATYTSVSQFISSHGNEAEALGADRAENGHVSHLLDVMRSSPGGTSGFNLSLLLGHTDGDLLHSSFWKGSDNHLNTGIPLSLTSGTISTTDASGSVIGGGKRMLSPTSSLELFIQSKQQKRVKEERMYGQIVKEMGAVELSGAERGSKPGKQEGSYQGLPFSRKDSVDECEQMSSSPPLTDPPAATKIAVPVRSSAPHLSDVPLGDSFTPPLQIVTERSVSYSQDSPDRLDVDDVSPGPSSSPEPMLSSSDAENSDQQPLLLKPAPTQSSGMMGGAQSLLFANLSEVQQLLHFPSLRTASRVSWCFRNYTKPNSTQATSQCSVYSSWSVSTHNPNPLNISTKAALALLRSKQRKNTEWLFTLAAMCPPSSGKLVSSEAWKLMFDQLKPDLVSADLKCFGRKMKGVESWERSKVELGEKVVSAKHLSTEPTRIKIFEGGYKSNEDYVYVRGRGRGKYICEECGIRCKKPSMLKKHIRTHTDVRPYVCKFCNFAFKTKGNLTKHMKSKAHIKKCLELGVSMSSVEDTEAEEGDIPEDGRGSSEKSARDRSVEHQFSDADDSDGAEDDGDEVEDEDDEEDDYDGDSTPKTGSRSCSPQPYSLPLMSIAPVATSNPTPHRATDLLGTPPSPPLLGYFTTVPSIQITPQAQSSEAAGRERVRAEDHGGQLQPVGSRLLPPPSSSSMDEDIPDLSSRLSSPGLEPPGCPSPISPSSSPSTHRYLSPCRNLSPSSRHLSPRRDISPLRHISTAGGYRRDLSPRRRHAVVSPLSRPLSPRGRDYRRDLSPQGQQKGMMRHVSPCRGPPHQSQQGVVWGPRGAALLHPDLPVGTLQTCMQLEANHPSSSLLHREQDQRSNQNHLSSAPLQVLFSHLPLHSQFPMPSSLPLIPVGGIHMVSSAPTPINSCLAQQAEVSTVSCLTLQKTTSDDSNSGEANILHFSSSSKRRGPAEAQGVMEASSPQHREGCGVRLEQEEGIQTCTQAIASLCIDSGRGRSIGDEGKGGNASSSFCPFPPPLMTLGSMSSLLPQPSQSHQNPGNQHLSTQDLRPPPPTVSSSSHAPHSPVSPLASKPANPESE